MGYMRHHLIAVSSHDLEKLRQVRSKALQLHCGNSFNYLQLVGEIVTGIVNKEHTFVIYPDGSKEGWDESNKCDDFRKELIEFIESYKNGDGSNSIRYAEIFYADDEKEVGIKGN